MATQPQELHLINARTKQELKLIEKAQFYRVGNEVVIGDLYSDPTDSSSSIISVIRKTKLIDVEELIHESVHNRRKEDSNESEGKL